jgi:hypothetical protein
VKGDSGTAVAAGMTVVKVVIGESVMQYQPSGLPFCIKGDFCTQFL